MSSASPKHALLGQLALVGKALGHPDRLELLEHLGQGGRSVEALARRVGLPVANVSQHLRHMKQAGLVTARRQGKFVHYAIADDGVIRLLTALRAVAEHGLADVEEIVRTYLTARDGLEPVSREDLLARTRQGLVTVLDVRPADEYAAGHVAGAVNIPAEDLKDRLGELDPATEIVAYCRGAYCVLSVAAVAKLRERGFRVRRLEDGFPEWKASGLPVSEGDMTEAIGTLTGRACS